MLHLKDFLSVSQPVSALDVGTRFGEFALALKEALPEGSRIVGLENNEKTLAEAKEKNGGRGIEFVFGDGMHMDFPDGSFDLVAISNTLHHILDYEGILREMLRVLRPGGIFLVNEMFSDHQDEAQTTHFLQHSFEAELDCISGGFQRATWKKEELLHILRAVPLSDVRTAERNEEPEMDRKLAVKNEKLCETAAKKAAGRPDLDAYLEKARAIQERRARYGIRRCTQLLYAGIKK